MCAIFGMGLFKNHKFEDSEVLIEIINRLFEKSEAFGRSASGLAVMREEKLHVLRRPVSGSNLIKTPVYLSFIQKCIRVGERHEPNNGLISIIGHCRLPTKGSPANNLNNHPIVIDKLAGVHNGEISNDDGIFEMFKKSIDRIAEVDTEIIFQLVNYFSKNGVVSTIDAIREAAKQMLGSYACGMLNAKKPHNLYLFRHQAPTKIVYYPKVKLIFFSTREYFILDAIKPHQKLFGGARELDMLDDTGVVFDLFNRNVYRFPIACPQDLDWNEGRKVSKQITNQAMRNQATNMIV